MRINDLLNDFEQLWWGIWGEFLALPDPARVIILGGVVLFLLVLIYAAYERYK